MSPHQLSVATLPCKIDISFQIVIMNHAVYRRHTMECYGMLVNLKEFYFTW